MNGYDSCTHTLKTYVTPKCHPWNKELRVRASFSKRAPDSCREHFSEPKKGKNLSAASCAKVTNHVMNSII